MTVLLILIVTPALNKIDASWEDLNQGGIPPLFDILLQLLQWTFMLVFGCFCPYFARLLKLIVIFWPIFSCPNKTKSNLIIRKIVCKNLYFQGKCKTLGDLPFVNICRSGQWGGNCKMLQIYVIAPISNSHLFSNPPRRSRDKSSIQRSMIIVFEKVPSAAA